MQSSKLQWSRLTRQAETIEEGRGAIVCELLQWSRLTRQAETKAGKRPG